MNMFAGMQQQPAMNNNNAMGGFGGFQSAATQQSSMQGQPGGQYYGGLVDLSAKGNTPSGVSGKHTSFPFFSIDDVLFEFEL